MSTYRKCATAECRIRLPDLKYDGHTFCWYCVGHICCEQRRCNECSSWPVDKFQDYLRHRSRLAVDRERKAKYRQKLRDEKNKSSAVSGSKLTSDNLHAIDSCTRPVHAISPTIDSSVDSVPKSVLHVDDVSGKLLSSTPVSHFSPTSLPTSVPTPPTAPLPPIGDQGITVDAFNSLVQVVSSMQQTLATLANRGQVHSASIVPPGQVLGSGPVGVTGQDPQFSDALCVPVTGGSGPGGESSPTGSCPPDLELVPDRSRKRFREPKDLKRKSKRSRAGESMDTFPYASRDTQRPFLRDVVVSQAPMATVPVERSTLPVSSVQDVVDSSMLGNIRSDRSASLDVRNVSVNVANVNVGLGPEQVVVPHTSPVSSHGHFNESMEKALLDICAKYPNLSHEEKVKKMKGYLKVNDPMNSSFVSSRSAIKLGPNLGQEDCVPFVSSVDQSFVRPITALKPSALSTPKPSSIPQRIVEEVFGKSSDFEDRSFSPNPVVLEPVVHVTPLPAQRGVIWKEVSTKNL